MNNETGEVTFSKAPTTELRKAAKASEMRTLMEDGKLKIFKGTTTLPEVVRITQVEHMDEMQRTKMEKTKFGIIVGERGFFPDILAAGWTRSNTQESFSRYRTSNNISQRKKRDFWH